MESRRGGAGGVARSSSELKAAWCKPYTGIMDPLLAEALALRDGAVFARLRGYDQVILETDSLEMVNLWHTRHDRSVVAPILTEIEEHASFLSLLLFNMFRDQPTFRLTFVRSKLALWM